MRRSLTLGLAAMALSAMSVLRAADVTDDDLAQIFRPFEGEQITLSPDGRHVAYTERTGEELFLVLRDLEKNTRTRVPVAAAKAEELSGAREKTPASLTFLRWATADRLVFNLNRQNVWSIRADGSNARRLADPRDFQDLSPLQTSFFAPPQLVPSVFAAVNLPDNQPVNVVALPRNDRYVYVEAVMRAYLSVFPGNRSLFGAPPRVVFRINIENGHSDPWGEVEARANDVMTDQQGHPRIATLRPTLKSLETDFIHAAPEQSRWTTLDELLGRRLLLVFHDSPDIHLGERSVPLGFDFDHLRLYFASNVGRDTFGVYAVDTKTWQRTAVAVETPIADLVDALSGDTPGDALVFDRSRQRLAGIRYLGTERATLWLDPELAKVQRTVAAALSGQSVELREWDETHSNFLVFAAANGEPGAFYLFHRQTNVLDLLAECAPWMPPGGRNPSASFAIRTAAKVNLTGYITVGRNPRLKKSPLIVLLHDGPWSRDLPGYNREAQALASLGFAVLQVNYRGSAGFGRQHLDALRGGPDAAPLEDALAAVDREIDAGTVDRRFVAIMGTGYGGYLALRALQLHPTRFRCAVAIDAPADLRTWVNPPDRFDGEVRRGFLGRDSAALLALSPLAHPEQITAPVMLVESDGAGAVRDRELSSALKNLDRDCTFLKLSVDDGADLPLARAALYRKIADFLNLNLYNYAVKLGEPVEKP